jgi:hypothetical protein
MNSQTANSNSARNLARCRHRTRKGRLCKLPVLHASSDLCFRHAGLRDRQLDPGDFSAELLGPLTEFTSVAHVNRFLGNLLVLHSRGRIAQRQATSLAYIAQLLLVSLPELKKEISHAEYLLAIKPCRSEPLPETSAAFADAVFRRVLGHPAPPPPAAPVAPHQHSNETDSSPRNPIR